MNIGIAKLFGKIVFDRKSPDALRSNTNGNYGTFKLFKMLFELNKNDEFFILGDSDYNDSEVYFDNVKDCLVESEIKVDEKLDCLLIVMGVDKPLENYTCVDYDLLKLINSNKWVEVSEDPRCVSCKGIFNKPYAILSQVDDSLTGAIYAGIERSMLYGIDYDNLIATMAYNRKCLNKFVNFAIFSNDGCAEYDRQNIIRNFLGDFEVPIIGRRNTVKNFDKRFIGEMDAGCVRSMMCHTNASLMFPIKKGWATSKYLELLTNDVFPFFYADYGIEYLDFVPYFCVVENVSVLRRRIDYINNYKDFKYNVVDNMLIENVKPYCDGKILSGTIMKILEECCNAVQSILPM